LTKFRSFEESVSFTSILLFDLFDFHEHDTLGSTDNDDSSTFANSALQSESDLFGSFGFFPEDRLGLSSIARLFAIVSASALSSLTLLSLFVLGNLVNGVETASGAVSLSGLGNNHHKKYLI